MPTSRKSQEDDENLDKFHISSRSSGPHTSLDLAWDGQRHATLSREFGVANEGASWQLRSRRGCVISAYMYQRSGRCSHRSIQIVLSGIIVTLSAKAPTAGRRLCVCCISLPFYARELASYSYSAY